MQNYRQLSEMLAESAELQTRINALGAFPKDEQVRQAVRVKVRLTHSCINLENGGLSETDVYTILVKKMAVGGRSLREHLAILGLARGVEHILELSRPPLGNGPTAPERTIKRLHKLCHGMLEEQGAGSYRKRRVVGLAHVCPRPQDIPALMSEFTVRQGEQSRRLHPLLYAAWLHQRFLEISPFAEGNHAVARLLLNLALLRRKHVPTPIPEALRDEYYSALNAPADDAGHFHLLLCDCHLRAQKEHLAQWQEAQADL